MTLSKIKIIIIPFFDGRSVGDRVEQEYTQLPEEDWETFGHRVLRIGALFCAASSRTLMGLAVIVQPNDRCMEWRSFMGGEFKKVDFSIKSNDCE